MKDPRCPPAVVVMDCVGMGSLIEERTVMMVIMMTMTDALSTVIRSIAGTESSTTMATNNAMMGTGNLVMGAVQSAKNKHVETDRSIMEKNAMTPTIIVMMDVQLHVGWSSAGMENSHILRNVMMEINIMGMVVVKIVNMRFVAMGD